MDSNGVWPSIACYITLYYIIAQDTIFSFHSNGAFHLYSEVGISEFQVGSFSGNAHWSQISNSESRTNLTTPTSKSKMAAPHINSRERCSNILFFSTSVYLCLIKTFVHTALSNFYLWTCRYGVCMRKMARNALLSTGIANNG